MSDDRFVVRARQVRGHRLRRIVLGVVAVLLVAVLAWLFWFSNVLAVHGVKVEGETTLKASQVLDAARVPDGRPLARLDLARIESRVAAMDRVESVDVTRSWPQTVTIKVVERKAIAWTTTGGKVRGIDRFGIDFRSYSKAPSSLVEVATTASSPEERLATTRALAAVVEDIRTREAALLREVQLVSAGTKDSIELDLTKGRTVVWGSADKAARKLEVLKPLLKIDATRYDVSAPDQPTTRA